MPGLDRTGPEGKGSQTGRKLGKCNPTNQQTDEQTESDEPRRGLGRRMRGSGRGLGKGQGRGRS